MPRQTKTPEQIRQTHGRYRLSLQESAIIPACLRLCCEWHNRIGACLTLDAERFRQLSRKLLAQPPFTEAQILSAIRAYHLDDWHQRNPDCYMEFGAWLRSGKFEKWFEKGQEREQRAARQANAVSSERTETQAIHAAAARMNVPVSVLVARAVDAMHGNVHNPTLTNPDVRRRVLAMLREVNA